MILVRLAELGQSVVVDACGDSELWRVTHQKDDECFISFVFMLCESYYVVYLEQLRISTLQ
jgi:hypothetical protein